jgi:predicted esterase
VRSSDHLKVWVLQKALGGPVDILQRAEDEAGIKTSAEYFHSMIQAEVDAGIPAERIVLGGFSQGGAMAIFSGLTSKVRIAGIVGLSSWLLLSKKFADYLPTDVVNKETPVFMGHGDRDPLVRFELGQMSEEVLKGMGFKVTMNVYR